MMQCVGFLSKVEWCSVYVCSMLLLHSSTEGHLCWLHALATVRHIHTCGFLFYTVFGYFFRVCLAGGKGVDLELASSPQCRWSQSSWQHPEHHKEKPVKHTLSVCQALSGYSLWPHQCRRVSSQPVWSAACWPWYSQWTQACCCLLSSSWLTQWSGGICW